MQKTFRTQKPYCKNFRWKYIKNESRKSYLVNKEQKARLPVVSQSDAHFGLVLHGFSFCPDLKECIQICFTYPE